jgi:hypothetical protein
MTQRSLPEAQVGPAEKLLDLVLSSGAHLWHNRLGRNANGVWQPAGRGAKASNSVKPGLFVPAAEALYARLVEIYQLNAELAAHFASYAIVETEWRDLKVACAAMMLVQPKSGQPIKNDAGAVEFMDDDFRAVGEAMALFYEKKSARMMTPKSILRVAELLETKEIAAINRKAGWGDPASRRAPLGRWPQAASRWLAHREHNPALLEGLVKAGYRTTIMNIARKAGYKPEAQRFFEILGWKQTQAAGGHRSVGMTNLKLEKKARFDDLSESEICEMIETEKLGYKETVGRLPAGMGLTPAIMIALLPSLSNADLRMLTPTLEEMGLLLDSEVRTRWEKAISEATDQRALNVAKNVKAKELREKLETAADVAVQKAVAKATGDADVRVMFLIDKSGSMDKAIDQAKEALSRILAGFPPDKVHIATFDTMGTVMAPKAPSRAGVQHMLQSVTAGGGTIHGAAVRAFFGKGVKIPADAQLIVIVVGDEAGEEGAKLANAFRECGYAPSAIAFICCVAPNARGMTVRQCAVELGVPFAEIQVGQFDDPYQVTRVLRTILDAPVAKGVQKAPVWVEKVMATPLLQKPVA